MNKITITRPSGERTMLASSANKLIGQMEQGARRGLRVTGVDGEIVCAYTDGAYRAYWRMHDTWASAEGGGMGLDGSAHPTGRIMPRECSAAEIAMLPASTLMQVDTDNTMREIEARLNAAVNLAKSWTPTDGDMRNLLLAWGAIVMHANPVKPYLLVGPSGCGKTYSMKELIELHHGTFGYTELLKHASSESARNMIARIQMAGCALFDEMPSPLDERTKASIEMLASGALPFAPYLHAQRTNSMECDSVVYATSLEVASNDRKVFHVINMQSDSWSCFEHMAMNGQTWAMVLAGAMAWIQWRGLHALDFQ